MASAPANDRDGDCSTREPVLQSSGYLGLLSSGYQVLLAGGYQRGSRSDGLDLPGGHRPRPALVLVTSRGTRLRPPEPEPEPEATLLSMMLEALHRLFSIHPRWYGWLLLTALILMGSAVALGRTA